MTDFKVNILRYRDKEFANALVYVDTNNKIVEIKVLKGFFRKKYETIASYKINRDEILLLGNKVKIGDAHAVFIPEENARDLWRSIFPRDLGLDVKQIIEAAREFFKTRIEVMKEVQELKTNPRAYMIKSSDRIPNEVDPVEYVKSQLSKKLEESYSLLKQEIESRNNVIAQDVLNRVQAGLYSIGYLQTALLNGDNSARDASLSFFNKIADVNYTITEEVLGKGIEYITDETLNYLQISSLRAVSYA